MTGLAAIIRDIITVHQPDEQRSCWANERWCTGCETNLRVFPVSQFPTHQAQIISDVLHDHLAGLFGKLAMQTFPQVKHPQPRGQ